MQSFSFENQGTNTYLVYAVSEEDVIDSMSLGMITNNKIPGLAPTIFTQMDANKYIKYNVSAKISVEQFFEGQVNKKRLLGVFNGIVDAMLSAEDYMIDTDSILLDLKYIFADVSTCETVLVCLPIEGQRNEVDLSSFFKTIMFSTQFDQTENCDHVAKIINYLNSSPVFSLTDFKGILKSLSGTATASQQPKVANRTSTASSAPKKSVSQPNAHPQQNRSVSQPVQSAPVQPTQVQTPPVPEAKPKKIPSSTPAMPAVQTSVPEKKISLFELMMHYNKENKALYDAQKAAKKTSGGKAAPTPQPTKQRSNPGFAVPGTQNNVRFAVPGQPESKPTQPPLPMQQQYQNYQQPAQPTQQPKPQTVQPSYNSPAAYNTPVQPQGKSASFGDTTVLSGGKIGETTVLGEQPIEVKVRPHLIRAKNNEQIYLDKPVFRIGKEKSYVDYFVGDNTAVSRSHCNIINRDGQYFIVDTNSTNHTYVNGGMIQSNVETALSHGTKIRLANDEFEFRMY